MTYLEKYRQIYGEDMEDDVLCVNHCPGYFHEICNADESAPTLLGKCSMSISCKECWNKEMEADHEKAN